MKTIKHFAIGIFAFSTILSLNSCGGSSSQNASTDSATNSSSDNKPLQEDELKGFMLGGIYFINGYGGMTEFSNALTSAGSGQSDIIDAAKQYMILPFKTDASAYIKQTLSSMWDINSKDSLLKILDDLKNHKLKTSYTKSWDYTRYVNDVCMGYAAGYLTEDEAKKKVAEVLPLAKADYKTWNDYFTDFAIGRDKWSASESGDGDKQKFDNLAKNITQGNNNIYTIIPLN